MVVNRSWSRYHFMFLRLSILLVLFSAPILAAISWPDISSQQISWPDGEKLTYLVSWGMFDAARGTFTARDQGNEWEFKLQLNSCGVVDSLYPFSDTLWSILKKNPPRSAESGEWRFEPKRVVQERTRIDYSTHTGTREIWSQGKTKTFSFPADGMDDVCSMLYGLRVGPWGLGEQRTLYVYIDNAAQEGQATCTEKITRSFGTFTRQPLIHLQVLPTAGTHHHGYLEVYLTDDARRIPLHADLEFRYGTFSIDLESTK